MTINEPMLRDALLSLAEQSKNQYAVLSRLLNEAVALRETMMELAGEHFQEVYNKHRLVQMGKTMGVESSVNSLIDELIRRTKDEMFRD